MRTEFKKTNLDWYVDYDYDRSQCTCNDYICRCTTIHRAWVERVHVKEVVAKLYTAHSKSKSDVDKYCFDRICHHFEIFDKELYDVETGCGYYGDEVYGVYFDNEKKIVDAYNELLTLETDIDKIKHCLKLEYGYLLDCIINSSYATISEVPTTLIRLPQREYTRKVSRHIIEDYQNSELPIAVCIKDYDGYRLIDGYHRFAANSNADKVNIIALY